MAFAVRIGNVDRVIDVDMGETILQAALRQGVVYPCGCQSGNCGACKSSLVSGEVELSPYSEYALTDAERRQGLILACRAVPWSDAEVAWQDQDETVAHPLRKLDCEVESAEPVTHDIMRVRLKILAGGPFDFSAGQYASVRFEGQAARDYSMASAPGESPLEFHIRDSGKGGVSGFVAAELRPGHRVRVEGPLGIAYLREAHTGPIIAVAGGSGLAPVRSIVKRALDAGMAQPIRLYAGVRDERDVYLEDELRALADAHDNLSVTWALSEPSAETPRRTGLLADVLRQDLMREFPLDGWKAYLAGPPVMVESCVAALTDMGLAGRDCHADAFYSVDELAEQERKRA